MLHRQHTAVREDAARLVVRADADYRDVRLELEHVEELAIAVEEVDAALKLVLEDEVFVVV